MTWIADALARLRGEPEPEPVYVVGPRPCPWCDEPLPQVHDTYVGTTWSVSAQTHMWHCQFSDLPASPVQAAAAPGERVSAALPASAPDGGSFGARGGPPVPVSSVRAGGAGAST